MPASFLPPTHEGWSEGPRGLCIFSPVQPRAFFVLANCFRWVLAGLRPASTHRKLFPYTGRERRHPAEVRTRPPPRRS